MARVDSDYVYGLSEKKCATCDKKFIPAPMHAYKRSYGSGAHPKWFCKYTCMLAWDREHPPKQVIRNKKMK